MSSRPNILIVILDSVRRDHTSVYGYERDTTPNLTRIARRAAVYENAIADGGWTPASVGSLFTGLCCPEHNAEERMRLPASMPTIAEAMAAAGYHTAAFSTNPFTLPEHGYGRGFAHFARCRPQKGISKAMRLFTKPLHLTDKGGQQANEGLLEHISDCSQPFFAFLHHNEAHCPYSAKRPYTHLYRHKGVSALKASLTSRRAHNMYSFMVRATEQDYSIIIDLYDGQIAYQDHLVGELWEGLDQRGLLENTIVLFIADHGELLGERGYLGHSFRVDEGLVHVPMVVHAPGILDAGSRMHGLVQMRDIGRTLCEVAGAEGLAPSSAPGVDIFAARGPKDGQETCFCSRRGLPDERIEMEKRRSPDFDFDTHNVRTDCARNLEEVFVRTWAGAREYYDLAADPLQLNNIANEYPVRAAELEKKLDAWLSEQKPHGSAEEADGETPPEVLDRLREFGYIP